VGPWQEDGRRKGDRFAISAMCVHSYLPALAAGCPDEAEEWISRAWEAWPQKGNVMGVFWGLYGRVEAALYRGDATKALALLTRQQGELGRYTHYDLMEFLNLVMIHLEGRAMLAGAKTMPAGRFYSHRAGLLRSVARRARKIEKANVAWSNPLAVLLRAGVAQVRDRKDEAVRLLESAAIGFDAANERMYAAAARRQRGRLLGGDEGRGLVRAAEEIMTSEGVRHPDRIAHMLAPGFTD
jgi:eukaryotic-like serine/threonine-protein kinase